MARTERHVAHRADETPAAVAAQRGAVFRVEKADRVAVVGAVGQAGTGGGRPPEHGEKLAADERVAVRTGDLVFPPDGLRREAETARGTGDSGGGERGGNGHAFSVLLDWRVHLHCGASHGAAEARSPQPTEQETT